MSNLEAVQLIDLMREELDARGWSDDDLLARADSDLDRTIIEILLAIPDEQRDPMSDEISAMLGRIFGMSPLMWKRLEESCRRTQQ